MRDSDIDSLSADGAQDTEKMARPAAHPADSAEALAAIEKVLVTAHREGWTYRRTSKAIAALQASAPSPAAEPLPTADDTGDSAYDGAAAEGSEPHEWCSQCYERGWKAGREQAEYEAKHGESAAYASLPDAPAVGAAAEGSDAD